MIKVQFYKNKNFFLNPTGWGDAEIAEVITLLDSIIDDLFSLFDSSRIPKREVIVLNSSIKNPPTEYPEFIKFQHQDLIILSAKDRFWSQYSYQFSHELCHHIIASNFYSTNDKFGWLEESICEMASIYCLKSMIVKWKINPPYPNWRDYSKSLEIYLRTLLAPEENKVDTPFHVWFNQNVELLNKNRYYRKENRIVAQNCLPLF